MEEVRNRIGGLQKALEVPLAGLYLPCVQDLTPVDLFSPDPPVCQAESWERRKCAKSESRRVSMGLASRRADSQLKMGVWQDIGGAQASQRAAERNARASINSTRQAAVRNAMEAAANRSASTR